MKKHNFFAGPSILPQYTLDKTVEGIRDFAGSGLSVLEISHRSKEFVACMNDTIALVKELLEVPESYKVIFLGGGASLQFTMLPMNMMNTKGDKIVEEDVILSDSGRVRNVIQAPDGSI